MFSLIMWALRSIESTLFDYRTGRVHKINEGGGAVCFSETDGSYGATDFRARSASDRTYRARADAAM